MMKKVLLIALCFVAFQSIIAQERPMSIDLQAGLPLGKVDDVTSLNSGLSFTYLFTEIAENFHLGARTGFSVFTNAFKSEIDVFVDQSFYFANLAVVLQYDFSNHFFGRLDLGYTYEIDSDYYGGFIYEPRVGYSINNFEAFAYFQHFVVYDDFLPMAVGVGVGYRF